MAKKSINQDSTVIENRPKEMQQKHHSIIRQSVNEIYDSARNSVLDLKRIIIFPSSEDITRENETTSKNTKDILIEQKENLVFDGELLTMRILFFDILFIICALVTDFVQASSILMQRFEIDGDLTY